MIRSLFQKSQVRNLTILGTSRKNAGKYAAQNLKKKKDIWILELSSNASWAEMMPTTKTPEPRGFFSLPPF